MHRVHAADVQQHATLGITDEAVPGGLHRQLQVVGAGKTHRLQHIHRVLRQHHHGGVVAVTEAPALHGLFKPGVRGFQHLADHAAAKRGEG